MSNSQLNNLKSGIKNGTEVRLYEAFTNASSASIKLSKTQSHKIGQSGEFLGKLSPPLLKTALPLIGNVLKPLAKTVLIPLWLTAAAAATDAAIHKKCLDLVIQY